MRTGRQETRTRTFDVVADRGGRIVSTIIVTTTSDEDHKTERVLQSTRVGSFEEYHGPCRLRERSETEPEQSGKRWRVAV
jgi:hypothetical protein